MPLLPPRRNGPRMSGASLQYDRAALAYALGSHVFWGAMPLYLLTVKTVPPVEFVAWRIVFTLPLCLAILAWRQAGAELLTVMRDRRTMLVLLGSSAMIGVNWFLYVWAIQTDHVYAASLGYYILPLVMMLLGLFFLGEKLTPRQWAAVLLAGLGVAALAWGARQTLWLSLSVGITFGIYGLLRKTVRAGPLVGLTLETLVLLPIAGALCAWYAMGSDGSAMTRDAWTAVAIIAGGPMTAFPLIMFATAARRLPYTVVGFLQFTSPTIVFLIGLFVFGEELQPAQLACFIAIWAAASLFVWDLLRGSRRSEVAA